MGYATGANGRLRRSAPSWWPIAMVVAAVAVASGTAAWMAEVDPAVSVSHSAPLKDTSSLFDNRFLAGNSRQSFATTPPPSLFVRPSELEIKLQQAKGLLGQKLKSGDSQKALSAEPPTIPTTMQTAT